MNLGSLPSLILALLKHQGTEALQAGKEATPLNLRPGTQVEAKVLDQLPGGRHLVQVGGRMFDMGLPPQNRAGDTVRLTFLSGGVRPTFALAAGSETQAAQSVRVSSAAQQVSAIVRYMPITQAAVAMPPSPGRVAAGPGPTHPSPGQAAPSPAVSSSVVVSPGAGAASHISVAATATVLPQGVPSAAGPAAAHAAPGTTVTSTATAATMTATPGMASTSPAPATASASPTVTVGLGTSAGDTRVPAGIAQAGPAAATPATAATAPPGAARPILANPALLLVPARAVGPTVTAAPGPVIPAMAMAGEAIDGMRPALGSQSSVVIAQGVVAEKGASHLLPVRLQQTVKESGLFYESHLGKWVRGEMSLESVQREPQARLAQAPGTLLDLPDLEGMPEQAARFAGRQLQMLEGGPFFWQGQVWPGQEASWWIQERPPGDPGAELEGQKWRSHLRLSLPRLGQVAADLDVGALGLRIRLGSASPQTLAEMKTAMPELVQRLRDAGVNLTQLTSELDDGG